MPSYVNDIQFWNLYKRISYLLHDKDNPNHPVSSYRREHQHFREDFIIALEQAYKVFRDNPEICKQLPDDRCDPIIGLTKINTICHQAINYAPKNDVASKLKDIISKIESGELIAKKPAEKEQKIELAKEPSRETVILDPKDQWIKVTEAARLLKVDKGTISRWADEDNIKDNEKKGKKRRVLKSSVLLMKHKRESENQLKDAADVLRDMGNKIPDRH